MQRRAAAAYVGLFVLIAVGSFAVISLAEDPTMDVDAEFVVTEGEEFTAGDVEYTVDAIDEGATGMEGELVWTNPEAEQTEIWDDGDEITYQDEPHTVAVADEDEPTSFELRPEDGDPLTFSEGDTLEWEGEEVTVDDVDVPGVTVSWVGPAEETIRLVEGDRVELGGTEYVAHFPDAETLLMTTEIEEYDRQFTDIQRFHDRMNGLTMGIAISSFAAIILAGMAYMPRRE